MQQCSGLAGRLLSGQLAQCFAQRASPPAAASVASASCSAGVARTFNALGGLTRHHVWSDICGKAAPPCARHLQISSISSHARHQTQQLLSMRHLSTQSPANVLEKVSTRMQTQASMSKHVHAPLGKEAE